MAFYDRKKRRDPSAQEQANWDALAEAERARRREIRRKELEGRGTRDSRHRMLDQMRKF